MNVFQDGRTLSPGDGLLSDPCDQSISRTRPLTLPQSDPIRCLRNQVPSRRPSSGPTTRTPPLLIRRNTHWLLYLKPLTPENSPIAGTNSLVFPDGQVGPRLPLSKFPTVTGSERNGLWEDWVLLPSDFHFQPQLVHAASSHYLLSEEKDTETDHLL